MKANIGCLLALFLLFCSHATLPIDNPHFYRALRFWDEPRFERNKLSSWQLNSGFARTSHSRDDSGKIGPLFDIIGPQNMQLIGLGVPNLDPANPIDQILIALAELPQNGTFGKLSFTGNFALFECIGEYYQNLKNGFFLQFHMPLIRSLTISNIHFEDLSPRDDTFPNITTPEWQAFLGDLGPIFNRYGVRFKPTSHRTGIGDFSFLAGWAGTYQDTCILDFLDASAKIGVLFPTAQTTNIDQPFDLPLGYNGHYGLPLKFDCAIGFFDWVTIGFHSGALFLFKKDRTIRLKTAEQQNGFILLAQNKVQIDPGTIWELGTYFKADHFVRGLSLLAGYSFTKRDADSLELKTGGSYFNELVINSDERLRGWNMHTVHAMIEYDCADTLRDVGPRIGFWFDIIAGGRRIFNAHLYDLMIGLDCAWVY
ncbi:MAG TPA: hypothetical protein VHO47_03215 [Candidatus Babeliales bacterium]|nr:hypothetical protein [Candidatus Babeliales bacterium]